MSKIKDIEKLKTQQHKLPSINRAKYGRRSGLEGPFMTKSGKVVYYDKSKGRYLDPATDMYLSYDAWKALGEEAPANATGPAVAGTGDDSSTVIVRKRKEMKDKLLRRFKIKETIDRQIPDLEYPKDEIKEKVKHLKAMAMKEADLDEAIKGLQNKAKKTGMPYSILKKVYDRGMAAWKGGHRPGATQQQWAFARVNSFVTKSPGTWGKADKDLAKKVRGS